MDFNVTQSLRISPCAQNFAVRGCFPFFKNEFHLDKRSDCRRCRIIVLKDQMGSSSGQVNDLDFLIAAVSMYFGQDVELDPRPQTQITNKGLCELLKQDLPIGSNTFNSGLKS